MERARRWTDNEQASSCLDPAVSQSSRRVAGGARRGRAGCGSIATPIRCVYDAQWNDATLIARSAGTIFTLRKQKDGLLSGRSRQVIFRLVRPTGNELPSYVPSYAITRLQDESSLAQPRT